MKDIINNHVKMNSISIPTFTLTVTSIKPAVHTTAAAEANSAASFLLVILGERTVSCSCLSFIFALTFPTAWAWFSLMKRNKVVINTGTMYRNKAPDILYELTISLDWGHR